MLVLSEVDGIIVAGGGGGGRDVVVIDIDIGIIMS